MPRRRVIERSCDRGHPLDERCDCHWRYLTQDQEIQRRWRTLEPAEPDPEVTDWLVEILRAEWLTERHKTRRAERRVATRRRFVGGA